jgi:hypothetical protein
MACLKTSQLRIQSLINNPCLAFYCYVTTLVSHQSLKSFLKISNIGIDLSQTRIPYYRNYLNYYSTKVKLAYHTTTRNYQNYYSIEIRRIIKVVCINHYLCATILAQHSRTIQKLIMHVYIMFHCASHTRCTIS